MMNHFAGDNALAYVNIILGVIGFSLLLHRTTRRWAEYPREVKLTLSVTLAFILALLETSAEQIAQDEPVSFNTGVIFIVKAYLIYVLYSTRSALYRTGTRQQGSLDTDDPNQDIVAHSKKFGHLRRKR